MIDTGSIAGGRAVRISHWADDDAAKSDSAGAPDGALATDLHQFLDP